MSKGHRPSEGRALVSSVRWFLREIETDLELEMVELVQGERIKTIPDILVFKKTLFPMGHSLLQSNAELLGPLTRGFLLCVSENDTLFYRFHHFSRSQLQI